MFIAMGAIASGVHGAAPSARRAMSNWCSGKQQHMALLSEGERASATNYKHGPS